MKEVIALEAGKIRTALHEQGYRTQPRGKILAYEIEKGSDRYLLLYLPRPVEDWVLLPQTDALSYQELWSAIQTILE
jgi:hypothetical protein